MKTILPVVATIVSRMMVFLEKETWWWNKEVLGTIQKKRNYCVKLQKKT